MDTIQRVECFKLAIPRDTPYLGKLDSETKVNHRGYFVRKENRSIYSICDNSLLVRITTQSGAYGWGECVTVVAPQVAESIIEQILEPFIIGRDPMNVAELYEDMYNSMRVRGFFGGFMMDAVSAVDIALWDLKGKLLGLPIHQLLGSQRHTSLPCYVSGLPAPTRAERGELAKRFLDKGFADFKLPIIMDVEHPVEEFAALRRAVGDASRLLVDFHWRYTGPEAVNLIRRMDEHDLFLAEAPVHAEDIAGQAHVTAHAGVHVGIGEELRTVYEYLPRFEGHCMDVIQPEMGRTGITAFWRICTLAAAYHMKIMPHASIGVGVFQAASLQASVAVEGFVMHEYQHSNFDRCLPLLHGNMGCKEGRFILPDGAGLGVEPTEETLEKFTIK